MFIKKSKLLKLVAKNQYSINRIKQLEDLLCPCEQHEYIIAEEETTFPYAGGYTVEVLHKRKLICRKCKKIVFDTDGCGIGYQYKAVNDHKNI